MLQEKLASSAARSSAFARVTTLAAAVVGATGIADLITGSVNLSLVWTCLVTVLALSIAAMPVLLGSRFPPIAGLAACWAFILVTSLQVAAGGELLMAVNNLVLYPMISCYLGWFFRPGIARVTASAQFCFSGAALLTTPHLAVFTTWANLALASFFCLEAALYLRARLDRQIETDPLTGAFNRIGLSAHLTRELSRAARKCTDLTVVAIDLDGFKAINDQLGHHAGDQTLVAMVDHFQCSLRAHDTVARIGGDEFVILLPDTPLAAAAMTMERLRAKCDTAWTFGLASALPSDTLESVMRRADDDLYVHKKRVKSGRSSQPGQPEARVPADPQETP